MSVLDRSALDASPLSDLHVIASELGLDGFRRLPREELIDAILARQGEEANGDGDRADEPAEAAEPVEEGEEGEPAEEAEEAEDPAEPERERTEGRRRRGRGRGQPAEPEPEHTVEGVVELLANGSGFVRVAPPDPSDDDVYISAAQVRRCELVSGDVIAGPVRSPRRSERFPSLVRVETINGAPADQVAEGTRYEDLPAAFPSARFALASEDPTLKAIEWLTPFGRGSRVTLAGPARSGKSEALRRLADALAATEGVEVFLVLAGVRPEEVAEWGGGPVPVTATALLGTSADTQEQAIDGAVEQGRRLAARGGDAIVLVDSLDGLAPNAARRALAAARNIADGGSLTVIATATEPLGGETTVIAFDARMASARRFPAIDVVTSGTMRPELLVGDAGAEAIARARAEVYG